MEAKSYDIIVVGAGVAGLTAAQYGARSGRSTLVVDGVAPGGVVMTVSEIENYPGFSTTPGYELTDKFLAQAKDFGAEVKTAFISKIEVIEGGFRLLTSKGELIGKKVILATGARHRTLDVPGEKELFGHGVSYCATCDGPFYKGKKMLVVGGGDAALDESRYLAGLTDHVVIVHRRDVFRAQGSVVEKVKSNPHIEVRIDTVVKEIKSKDNKLSSVVLEKVRGEGARQYEEDFDVVFVFIGSDPVTGAVAGLVDFAEDGSVETNMKMETRQKGLFAVGDVRNTPFRQIATGVGDAAIAAHVAISELND